MPLIWDVFNFNDELDLLELRLELLGDTVDVFVVIEAPLTFTGKQKPLHFMENQARFARWRDQLRQVTVAFTPTSEPWDREHEQRRHARDFILKSADPEDLVVFGDVDELLRPSALESLRSALDFPVRLGMVNSNYYANWTLKAPFENGPVAFRVGMESVPEVALVLGDPHSAGLPPKLGCLPNFGWHLSFSGGTDAVRSKLASYSHQEFNPSTKGGSWTHAERSVRYGVNPMGYEVVEWSPLSSLDPILQDAAERWPGFFRPEPFSDNYLRRRAYAGYTYARRRHWLPARVRDVVDEHHERAFGGAWPAFLLVDLTRRVINKLQRR